MSEWRGVLSDEVERNRGRHYRQSQILTRHDAEEIRQQALRLLLAHPPIKIDWRQRISDAKARGKFDMDDVKLASLWPTCACGEQIGDIPRGEHGVPLDSELARLGNEFYTEVVYNDFKRATRCLEKIEQRVKEL